MQKIIARATLLLFVTLWTLIGFAVPAMKPGKVQHPPEKKWQRHDIASPDKHIQVTLIIGDKITYDLSVDGKQVLAPAEISLEMGKNGEARAFTKKPGHLWQIGKIRERSIREVLTPVVSQKSAKVTDNCTELRIEFKNKLALTWRVYDNGVAWHWSTILKEQKGVEKEKGSDYIVKAEIARVGLNNQDSVWYPLEQGFYSGNERAYTHYPMDSVGADKLGSLPLLMDVKGIKLLLTESSLFNYPGMWVRGGGRRGDDGDGQINAVFPAYPKTLKRTSDRDEKVTSRAPYIAKVKGSQELPWRILMIARQDKDILSNQLVYILGRPATEDFSWVKPGKVQWDWWHYNNVYNVDFRAGINNDTYKYYVDFASKNKIEYVLLDEGWCDTRDLLKQSKDIDVPALAAYAKKRKVGLLLWASWLTLDNQMDIALDSFAAWGIKGIKIDFMQRDDQLMVQYYEKIAKAAAKRKLLVDFHGAYKPTGWLRSYPNVLTSEGVMGNELSKFTNLITPGHTTTLPYTRMAAGPMDFTPGGMRNAQKDAFAVEPSEPFTLGTRCNQLAMYVIYESPLQMLCDIPTHYMESPKAMELLSVVPTVWKQTLPLDGKVGQSVVMAREALNDDWYIGAMTNWTHRAFDIKLDFLPSGKYKMIIWEDGINADRNAKDLQLVTRQVDHNTTITISMAKGGGYVARLIKL